MTPATTAANDGNQYAVTVSSSFGTVTSAPVRLTVSQPQAVSITTQPASTTAVVGQTATFSVVATGSPELAYAWTVNGAAAGQGTGSTFTTPVLTAPGTQNIAVTVTNPLGKVTSNTAVLTVTQPVAVTFVTQPASQVAAVNQPVQLAATVAGSAPFTFQWTFTPAGGAATVLTGGTQTGTAFTYTVPAMTAATVGAYALTVNNAAGAPVTSAPAQLTLAPPGINLAYARTATASSSENPCTDTTTAPPLSGTGCLGAENAVDGDLTDRWGSAIANAPPNPAVPNVDPSWLAVDLGSVQTFNTTVINWESAYATQYEIDYTNDNPASASAHWSTAVSNPNGAGQTETLSFPSIQARPGSGVRMAAEWPAHRRRYRTHLHHAGHHLLGRPGPIQCRRDQQPGIGGQYEGDPVRLDRPRTRSWRWSRRWRYRFRQHGPERLRCSGLRLRSNAAGTEPGPWARYALQRRRK